MIVWLMSGEYKYDVEFSFYGGVVWGFICVGMVKLWFKFLLMWSGCLLSVGVWKWWFCGRDCVRKGWLWIVWLLVFIGVFSKLCCVLFVFMVVWIRRCVGIWCWKWCWISFLIGWLSSCFVKIWCWLVICCWCFCWVFCGWVSCVFDWGFVLVVWLCLMLMWLLLVVCGCCGCVFLSDLVGWVWF